MGYTQRLDRIHPLQYSHDPREPLDQTEGIEWLGHWDDLQHLLPQIDPLSADLLELNLLRGCSQTDLAVIFELSQAGVSYRIRRGVRQLTFLRRLGGLSPDDPEQIKTDLAGIIRPNHLARLPAVIRSMGCQVVAARELGISQGVMRSSLVVASQILNRLAAPTEVQARYRDLLQLLRADPTLMIPATAPTWAEHRPNRKPGKNGRHKR